MKISVRSIEAVTNIVIGDIEIAPYRTGPELVKLFKQYGFQDEYGSGFPARYAYAEERIQDVNDSPLLAQLIRDILDPRNFIGTDYQVADLIAYLKEYLRFDGYDIVEDGPFYKVINTSDDIITVEAGPVALTELNQAFINEQISKCRQKTSAGDYDGAITNARSLVEAVLIYFERLLYENPEPYNGDLNSLYKRVRTELNLDPGSKDISDTLKQILSGLISVVSGLSGLRNKMSDAHAVTYKPHKHHAKLAVNSAKTLVDFLYETYSYQQKKHPQAKAEKKKSGI